MIRELMRELLSANLFVTGIILTVASLVVFFGSIYLINYTNLGKKLAFLVTFRLHFGGILEVFGVPSGFGKYLRSLPFSKETSTVLASAS